MYTIGPINYLVWSTVNSTQIKPMEHMLYNTASKSTGDHPGTTRQHEYITWYVVRSCMQDQEYTRYRSYLL